MVSRTAGRDYLACARIKKPISGNSKIGAHFVSFNFLNNLICGIASRVLGALAPQVTI